MIVIVSYKQKELLDNANIDAIKELYGQFTVDDLINNFKNYFFTKMIVDATSVVDFTKRDVLTKLSNEFGADKLILLLPEKPDPPQKFIDMLKDIGIKNYCTKVDELNKFLNDNTMPSNEFDNKINQIENNDSSDNKEQKGLEDFNSDINTMNNDFTNDFDNSNDDYDDEDQNDSQFDNQDDNFNDFVNYQATDNNQNNTESQNTMDNSSYFQDATNDNNMNQDYNINEKHDDMNFSNNINNPFDVNSMNQNNDNSYNNSSMNNNEYMDNRFNDSNNDNNYSNQNMSNDYSNQNTNNNFNNFSNNDYNNQSMNNNFNNFNMNNNGYNSQSMNNNFNNNDYNNQNMNNNYNNQDMGNIYDNNNNMNYEDNNPSDIYNDSGSDDNSLMFFQNVDDNNSGSSTPNNFVLGIKAVTEQAGTTSLIYMLKKEMEKNNINVAAYEYLTNDFRYFRSNNMFSINNENELKDKINNDNFSVKILDLNNNEYDSLCTDILYLVEPSIIKMNKLTSSNPSLFGSLVDKKVVLNKCLLSEKEIGIFEREAQMHFFATIPPLNDRGSMNSLDEIIRKLNLK